MGELIVNILLKLAAGENFLDTKSPQSQSAFRPTKTKGRPSWAIGKAFGLTLQESKGCKLESSAPPRSGAPTELFDVRID
jgi:hypothetical protein